MSFPYIIQTNVITVVINGTTHVVNSDHLNFNKIRDAIRTQQWSTIESLINVKTVISQYSNKVVEIKNGVVYYKGTEMHNALATKMIQMYKEGFSIDPLVAFMTNLMQNPSKRAVDELYTFLERGNLPITPDGYFLAYKKVNDNYRDVYSNTFDNRVGQVVQVERNSVDDNANNTCSYGLHFCSLNYLKSFGGSHTMIVKINPADVVAIPVDYQFTKGRCCKYEVVGEVSDTNKPEVALTAPVTDVSTALVDMPHLTPTQAAEAIIAKGLKHFDKNGNPLSMTVNAVRKRIIKQRDAQWKVTFTKPTK